MSPDTTIIFGPPGTGKTWTLLDIIDQKLRGGLPASKICYIGFTRRAANEAKERAIEKFALPPSEFPWFRTLHSLCFQMLTLGKSSIMGIGDYLSLCKSLGLSITVGGINNDEGSFGGQTKGDRLFFAEAMSRSRIMTLKKYWETIPDEDIYFYELQQLRDALETYKSKYGKKDFTDIVYEYTDRQDLPTPSTEVLIVDEAQDLSPLQWKLVDKLSEGIGETYIAGDDDQAIFRWAGANVDNLIALPGKRTILSQSYRIPEEIQRIANGIAARISTRVEKTWSPREAKGLVEYVTGVDELDFKIGDWLLLVRNAFLLEVFTTICLREGYLFDAKNSTVDFDIPVVIKTWRSLCQGRSVSGACAKKLYSMIASKTGIAHGFKGKIADVKDTVAVDLSALQKSHGLLRKANETWDIVLDRIVDQDREYFLAAERLGEDVEKNPRIRISTIHGAKGAEATNVVVLTDMAPRTFCEMEKMEDDEHRVWYVAVTRARERLIIVQPMSDKYYQI